MLSFGFRIFCWYRGFCHRTGSDLLLFLLRSVSTNSITYFTGSTAEGLVLPGSDKDYMLDINKKNNMLVIQTELEAPGTTQRNLFVMSTENVRPCFAMLRSVSPIRDRRLLNACQDIDSSLYLSSFLYVHQAVENLSRLYPDIVTTQQGPSVEVWDLFMDRSQSGRDNVLSIHCSFWPNAASEWRTRSRRFPWPSQHDMKAIVDFGFHLVPVGHPDSDTNMMEWRISFSVAERTLVWSFNHIQMQCYGVMKLILKEFINPRCSPDCQVLCSYFIKTFLFWEYEETYPSYWCKENFRECVMRLLTDFCRCVRMRSLRHYFIPSFNLLSVKMTDEAKMELLRIFDIILQSEISIFKNCKTLNKVWFECCNHDADTIDVPGTIKMNMLAKDVCIMAVIHSLQLRLLNLCNQSVRHLDILTLTNQFINHFRLQNNVHKAHLASFAIRILLTNTIISFRNMPLQSVLNKTIYRLRRFLQSNVSGIDISTCRLWYAMLMTKCGDYHLSLRIINKILSNISPFILYFTGSSYIFSLCHVSDKTKERYVDVFSCNDTQVTKRARKTWMFDLRITPSHMDTVPAAIQIELVHCYNLYRVHLSPFVCAYYLMFLNYCGLSQYDNRDRALRQLIDVVYYPEQCGHFLHHSYNIAGHCLLSVGETEQARDMFMRSYEQTLSQPVQHRLNSALYYLQFLSQNATNR